MKNQNILFGILVLLFVTLMSVPYLVPHTGFLALIGFVPLLCLERIATLTGAKRVWLWHYSAFLLWNAVTTFWVCNATVGGGIFACIANAFQMSLVFGLFRWSRKYLRGSLPYIFLAALWIAWENTIWTWPRFPGRGCFWAMPSHAPSHLSSGTNGSALSAAPCGYGHRIFLSSH